MWYIIVMKKMLIVWGVNILSLWVVAALMKSIDFSDFWALALTALILSILNVTLKPILKLLSLPISVLTLGLFSIVIDGLVLYLAIQLSSGSYISSFGSAILASVLLSLVNSGINMLME